MERQVKTDWEKYSNVVGLDLDSLEKVHYGLEHAQDYLNCVLCINYLKGNLDKKVLANSVIKVNDIFNHKDYTKYLKYFEFLRKKSKRLVKLLLHIQTEVNRVCNRNIMWCTIRLKGFLIYFGLDKEQLQKMQVKVTDVDSQYIKGLVKKCNKLMVEFQQKKNLFKEPKPKKSYYPAIANFMDNISYIIAGALQLNRPLMPTFECTLLVEYYSDILTKLFEELIQKRHFNKEMVYLSPYFLKGAYRKPLNLVRLFKRD